MSYVPMKGQEIRREPLDGDCNWSGVFDSSGDNDIIQVESDNVQVFYEVWSTFSKGPVVERHITFGQTSGELIWKSIQLTKITQKLQQC